MLKIRISQFCWLVGLLLLSACPVNVLAQDEKDDEPLWTHLRLTKRINAHGDEFNDVVISPDEKRLVIGTEKGELIVWSLSEKRILSRFNQGSPVHSLVMLADGRHVVAGGGPHIGKIKFGVVRCWDIETGAVVDWHGLANQTIAELAVDQNAGLVAGCNADGQFVVWQARNGKLVATWKIEQVPISIALADHRVYVTAIDLSLLSEGEDFSPNTINVYDLQRPFNPPTKLTDKEEKKLCGNLKTSPDGRWLAAVCLDEDERHRLSIRDTQTGLERTSFAGNSLNWFAPDGFIICEGDEPDARVRLQLTGEPQHEKLIDKHGWHGNGQPAGLSEIVASRDGAIVWGVFKKGAALVEWRLAEKQADLLTMTPGNIYTMAVTAGALGAGKLITGGDDGFARVWSLDSLALLQEFKVAFGVPQSVGLLNDGEHAVISYSTREAPSEVVLADLRTGTQKKLLQLEEPFTQVYAAGGNFVYAIGTQVILAAGQTGTTLRKFELDGRAQAYAVSANGRWLVVADEKSFLRLFDLTTGETMRRSSKPIEDLTRLAIANDGQHVYAAQFNNSLNCWEVERNEIVWRSSVYGQCRSLQLSAEENRVLFGGNHRDLGIYDAKTGKQLFTAESDAADFYVTNLWLSGTRLVHTTDGGVMFEGRLEKKPPK